MGITERRQRILSSCSDDHVCVETPAGATNDPEAGGTHLVDPSHAGLPSELASEPQPLHLNIPGLDHAAAAAADDPSAASPAAKQGATGRSAEPRPPRAAASGPDHRAPSMPAAVSTSAEMLQQGRSDVASPRVSIPGITPDPLAADRDVQHFSACEVQAAPKPISTPGLADSEATPQDSLARSARPRSGGALSRRSRISKFLSPETRPGIAAASVAAISLDRGNGGASGEASHPGGAAEQDEIADQPVQESSTAWGLSAQQRQRIAMRDREARAKLDIPGDHDDESMTMDVHAAATADEHQANDSSGVIDVAIDEAPPGVRDGHKGQPSLAPGKRTPAERVPISPMVNHAGHAVQHMRPEVDLPSARADGLIARPLSASEQTDLFLNSLASEPVRPQAADNQPQATAAKSAVSAHEPHQLKEAEAQGADDAWPAFDGSQDTEGPQVDGLRFAAGTPMGWEPNASLRISRRRGDPTPMPHRVASALPVEPAQGRAKHEQASSLAALPGEHSGVLNGKQMLVGSQEHLWRAHSSCLGSLLGCISWLLLMQPLFAVLALGDL